MAELAVASGAGRTAIALAAAAGLAAGCALPQTASALPPAAPTARLVVATEGFEASLRAADARWRGGVGSLFELEDARRSALAVKSALVELRRERAKAWINLYRALGGGWSPDDRGATTR